MEFINELDDKDSDYDLYEIMKNKQEIKNAFRMINCERIPE